MNRKNILRLFAAIVAVSLLAVAASGCEVNENQPPTTELKLIDGVYHVDTVEQFLEAIRPGAKIAVVPGKYNLTESLETLWKQKGDRWNTQHEYVQINECMEAVELVVRNADGLTVYGMGKDRMDTELCVSAQYGTVLTFENCSDLTLENLTLGHRDVTGVSGDTLRFRGSQNVSLRNLDLFGGSNFGIYTDEACGDFSVADSVIRDCRKGPLSLNGGTGSFAFTDCALINSQGGGALKVTDGLQLRFYRCTFGIQETAELYSRDDMRIEECVWDDPGEDYAPADDPNGEIYFDLDSLSTLPFDATVLADSQWTGHILTDLGSGDSHTLPYEMKDGSGVRNILLRLNKDGTGALDGFIPGEMTQITWKCEGEYEAYLYGEDLTISVSLYADPTSGEGTVWLMANSGETVVWFY